MVSALYTDHANWEIIVVRVLFFRVFVVGYVVFKRVCLQTRDRILLVAQNAVRQNIIQ